MDALDLETVVVERINGYPQFADCFDRAEQR